LLDATSLLGITPQGVRVMKPQTTIEIPVEASVEAPVASEIFVSTSLSLIGFLLFAILL
jgi:hypothetical protein